MSKTLKDYPRIKKEHGPKPERKVKKSRTHLKQRFHTSTPEEMSEYFEQEQDTKRTR